MKITIAQLNPVVGDVEGNLERIKLILAQDQNQSDLVVLPELFLTGYPPVGILEREWFLQKTANSLRELVSLSRDYSQTGILVGAPTLAERKQGRVLHNSALLIYRGEIVFTQHKSFLPAYDLFNEAYYFKPAEKVAIVDFKGTKLGIILGEDLWQKPVESGGESSPVNTFTELAGQAGLIINIAAFPFYMGWEEKVYELASEVARKHKIPLLLVNQVGGNDELIFNGQSMFFNEQGESVLVGPSFKEYITTLDTKVATTRGYYSPRSAIGSVHDALVLGIRDYFRKTGFIQAVLGLSGGIDSAVVCCLAAKALGSENVLGISMPSPYSSTGSVEDSRELAHNLGVKFKVIPIAPLFQEYLHTLQPYFQGEKGVVDTTEENLQARIRGNILMAFSNKYGYLLLVAGNKSELLVGYCTLYGDMSGGLSVITDLSKTLVYELAAYINKDQVLIPEAIINKAPSAELRPDQVDQDTLPPYSLLDQVLDLYMEENRSPEEIIALGFEEGMVRWVIQTVKRNEYKRRQAVLGLRVTRNPLGPKRQFPVAAKF